MRRCVGSPDLSIHPLQILCPASLPAFSALQPSRMSVTLYFFWLSSSAYRVRIALYWKRIPEKRRGRRGRSHWCGVENGRGNSCNGTAHASGPSRGVTARGLVAPSAQRGAWSESLGRTTCFRRWRGSQRTVAAPGCDAVAYSLRIACPIVYDTKMRFFYSLSILIISPIAEGNYDLQASGAGEIWTKGGQSGGAPYNFNSAFMSYDGTGGGDLLGPGFANYVWGTTVSYAVWVNVQSFGSPAPLFANNLDASPPTVSFSLTVSSPSGSCTPMCVNYYVAAPGCTPATCTISASAPGLGVWFHVAMTYDGQTLSGYVNGILVASFKPVGGGALPTLPNAVMIASMKQRSGIFSFADGRLYSRSLSTSEVVAIKAGGCVQSGLVAWYSLADYSNPWANQVSASCTATPSPGPVPGQYDLFASGTGEIWTKGGQSGGAPYNFNSAFMSYDGTGGGDLLGPGFANYVWGTTVSYAVWVNVQSFGSPAPLFANNLDASPPTVSFSLTVSSPSGSCTPMCVNYYVAAPGCTPATCTISASAPGLGVWFHVAMTYDGQTLSGYVNGILVASFKPVGGGALPTLPNAVMIASMKQRSGIFSFADGRLYSRSLSTSEVVAIKAGGCVQSGLVAWYSLADYSNPWANQASSSCIPTPSFSQTRSLSPSQAPTVTLSPTASITPSGSPTISLTKSVSHSMSRASRSRSASISISPSPSVGAIRPLIFSGSPTARPPAQPATGLSEGDIIGIVVGVVGVLIAAAVVLFYYFWPRRANGYIALMSLTLGTSGGGANSINNDGHSSHDTRRTDTCVVCMDSPRTTVLLPCGHRCVCGACTSRLLDAALPPARRLCPICRAVITATVVPYD